MYQQSHVSACFTGHSPFNTLAWLWTKPLAIVLSIHSDLQEVFARERRAHHCHQRAPAPRAINLT